MSAKETSISRVAACLAAAPTALLAATPALAVDETFDTEGPSIHVRTVADGLSHPWALAFLPDGSMLVTERPGALRHVTAEGKISEPITGVPEVDARNQGGLLDVALDPDFGQNRRVYLSYAETGEGGNGTAVARGVLGADHAALSDVEVIFRQQPKADSTKHFGSRLVFDGQGHLFVTLGERSDEEFRGQAQDLDSHLGKIVRIHPDGSVPEDNPFVGQDGALPEIWSYGNRNVQAAAIMIRYDALLCGARRRVAPRSRTTQPPAACGPWPKPTTDISRPRGSRSPNHRRGIARGAEMLVSQDERASLALVEQLDRAGPKLADIPA